jgi:hypothetical protein
MSTNTPVVALVLVIAVLTACAGKNLEQTSPYLAALAGAGIVLVPKESPHVASRLLLREASEQTPDISEFIRDEGYPEALAVTEGGEVALYYTSENVSYTLRKIASTWIVDGPKPMEAITQSQLRQKIDLPALEGEQGTAHNVAIQPSPPTTPNFENDTPPVAPLWVRDTLQNYASDSAPKERIRFNTRGDLLHRIFEAHETLQILAAWYTFESVNAAQISRINRRELHSPMVVGDEILIPAYLLRNRLALPLGASQGVELSEIR